MKRTAFVIILALTHFVFLRHAHAQQSQPMQWSTNDGNQYLETSEGTLHLLPRTDSKGPRTVTATAKLNLPDTQKWEVSFDIRFGALKDMGSSFHIMRGDTNIGWVGADGVWKTMGVFVGKSGELISPPADLEWHHINYISNGEALTVSLDGKQVSSVPIRNENIQNLSAPDSVYLTNGQDMAQPCTQTGVWVRNVQVQSGMAAGTNNTVAPVQVSSTVAQMVSDARPQQITLRDDEQSICCLPGDVLHMSGHYSSDRHLIMRYLDTGNSWEFKSDINGKSDDYNYDWTAPKPGVYHLVAGYSSIDNLQFSARTCTVTVLATAPFTADVPQTAVSDAAVTLHETDPSLFHTDRISYQFNGEHVNNSGTMLQAKLPIASLPNGNYTFAFEAVDKDKGRFVGNNTSVFVPERVQVAVSPSVTLAQATDTVPLDIVLAPGVTPAKVTYMCDGQTIATADHAPYQSTASLSAFASGTHNIIATAETADGHQYQTPGFSISLVNQPQDKQKAEAAVREKAIADAKSAEAAERTHIAQEKSERLTREATTIPYTDDSKATLEETFAWITRTINNSSGVNLTDGSQFEVWDSAKFDQYTLVYQYRNYLPHMGWDGTSDIRVPFDKLGANEVRISVHQQDLSTDIPLYYAVEFQCAGNANLISAANLYRFQAPTVSKQNRSSDEIRFEDKQMAVRFAKAVLHAVRLCKSNQLKEPF